jgi:hypothetical protein
MMTLTGISLLPQEAGATGDEHCHAVRLIGQQQAT